MAQIGDQAVGKIDSRCRQVTQRLTLQHARHRAQMTSQQVVGVRRFIHRQPVLQHRQAGGAVSRGAGDIDPVSWLRASAFYGAPWRHKAVNTQRHGERATGGITANQLHIVIVQLDKQAVAKGFQPGFIHLWQSQRQREPRRFRAHRREVAQVHRQRFISEVGRVDIG